MTAKRSVWFKSALWLGGFTFLWTFSASPADAYLQVKKSRGFDSVQPDADTLDQPSLLPPTFIPPEFEDLGLPPAPTASAAMFVNANVTDNGRYGGGSFRFDTSAQVTVISTDNALDLGLNLASPKFTVEITGIGGTQTAPGYSFRPDSPAKMRISKAGTTA